MSTVLLYLSETLRTTEKRPSLRACSWLAIFVVSLYPFATGSIAHAQADSPSEISIPVSREALCKASNYPFKPASDIYVDSGRIFSVDGEPGTTCWNRLDNATSETPSSFAGAAGKWYLFAAADCPETGESIMKSWPMRSADPILDNPCVHRPPLVVTCKTSNHPFRPSSRTYVDSGRPFVVDGVEGTTCWNRIDNDSSATPSSFAGHGDKWFLFAGADCPPDNSAIMYTGEKRTDDPIQDLACVELPPVAAPTLKLTCEGPSMGFDTKGTYVDSGLTFEPGGEPGTTCWNRQVPDADTRPASFAGYGGEWLIFAGADCPPVSSSVVFSWAKKTDDPVADVPCVDR